MRIDNTDLSPPPYPTTPSASLVLGFWSRGHLDLLFAVGNIMPPPPTPPCALCLPLTTTGTAQPRRVGQSNARGQRGSDQVFFFEVKCVRNASFLMKTCFFLEPGFPPARILSVHFRFSFRVNFPGCLSACPKMGQGLLPRDYHKCRIWCSRVPFKQIHF